MRFGIIVFPGSNCDRDCFDAVRLLGHEAELIWHQEHDLRDVDCVILPGGFSYGDHLRAGAIARFAPVMSEVKNFAESGGLVMGICNGFQILLESGLLPGAMRWNRDVKFICRNVHLRVEQTENPFLSEAQPGQVIELPIAHNEGNYYIGPNELAELEANEQILLKYSDPAGNTSEESNPNGAVNNIAGIMNKGKNVFGLMPHPERAVDEALGRVDGRIIFSSIVKTLEKSGATRI